ncbi:hypothetical protein HK097_008493 [Rhizophlyctis rosea]|uniref:DUF4200 domain-containing protein n=1 Tax=Rhizophlyctis rosea TaxID=64517 RepID=A0AAD5X8G3_9FUNG|nr:hypothetical protein HK097_008493 [Rhizophlyctis rosea]
MAEVEPVSAVGARDGETFVTQRGGKIIQGIPVLQNERPPSMFESRRTLQSTLLLRKKKEMQAVQALLEKKRAEFAKRMEECREKQEELRARQKKIRDDVTKFEKHLKDNDAKRQRANLKAQTERKLREMKEMEMAALQRQLHEEQLKSEKMLRMIKKYQIYERYLQSVVDILPPDYLDVNEPHINDILMRHKTLVETNDDLVATVQQSQDEIEHQQAQLAGLIKAKNDLILVYNSTLGTQQKKLDQLKQECAYLEQRLEERDNTGKERASLNHLDKLRILSETKLAINNIFDRVGIHSRAAFAAAAAAGVPVGTLPTSQTSQARIVISGPDAPFAPPTGVPIITVPTLVPPPNPTAKDMGDNTLKGLADKLHAIQDRVLDLQHIAQRAEQAIAQERAERAKKHVILAEGPTAKT